MDHIIKRVINETLMEKFFDSMFSDLDLDNLESMPIKDDRTVHKNSVGYYNCLLYTSPSPRDRQKSRMPSSA